MIQSTINWFYGGPALIMAALSQLFEKKLLIYMKMSLSTVNFAKFAVKYSNKLQIALIIFN